MLKLYHANFNVKRIFLNGFFFTNHWRFTMINTDVYIQLITSIVIMHHDGSLWTYPELLQLVSRTYLSFSAAVSYLGSQRWSYCVCWELCRSWAWSHTQCLQTKHSILKLLKFWLALGYTGYFDNTFKNRDCISWRNALTTDWDPFNKDQQLFYEAYGILLYNCVVISPCYLVLARYLLLKKCYVSMLVYRIKTDCLGLTC